MVTYFRRIHTLFLFLIIAASACVKDADSGTPGTKTPSPPPADANTPNDSTVPGLGSCKFESRTIINDKESITVGNRYYNYVGDTLESQGTLEGVERYANGPCQGIAAGQCRFDTRAVVGDRESITVGNKFWNFKLTDYSLDSTGTLESAERYASGPCQGVAAGQCRFDTRAVVGELESITVGNKFWNYKVTDHSLDSTGTLESVERYASGPCQGVAVGQCKFDTRAVIGELESITVNNQYWNYKLNVNTLDNTGKLSDVSRYLLGPCKSN